MSMLKDAVAFAFQAHQGQLRKGTHTPYIVHPLETLCIAWTMTNDEEVLCGAVLHDVIEDAGIAPETLCRMFSPHVAELVALESEDKQTHVPPAESWEARKKDSIKRVRTGTTQQKIIALADKLSNLRAIRRDYSRLGEALWTRFHETRKEKHAWYYRGMVKALEDLSEYDAYKEFSRLVCCVFG